MGASTSKIYADFEKDINELKRHQGWINAVTNPNLELLNQSLKNFVEEKK